MGGISYIQKKWNHKRGRACKKKKHESFVCVGVGVDVDGCGVGGGENLWKTFVTKKRRADCVCGGGIEEKKDVDS